MTQEDVSQALVWLQNNGHRIGTPFVDFRGHVLIVVDGLAMTPTQAVLMAAQEARGQASESPSPTGQEKRVIGFSRRS